MRVAKLCFVLAGVLAISAAGLVAAQTTYPNERCISTPRAPFPSQCGCPVPPVVFDFCENVAPPAGQTNVTYYYCSGGYPGATCTSPDRSCGSCGQAIKCPCWTCDGSGGMCPPQGACGGTEGKKGACCQDYGCTGTY